MQVQELLEINLLDQIHFTSEEEKEDFAVQYTQILFGRIIDRVSLLLEPQELDQITTKMDQDAEIGDVLESLVEYVPQLSIIIGEEVLDLKEETLELLPLTA